MKSYCKMSFGIFHIFACWFASVCLQCVWISIFPLWKTFHKGCKFSYIEGQKHVSIWYGFEVHEYWNKKNHKTGTWLELGYRKIVITTRGTITTWQFLRNFLFSKLFSIGIPIPIPNTGFPVLSSIPKTGIWVAVIPAI